MKKGGRRPNSGRKNIVGKQINIKVEEELLENIEKAFKGNTRMDKIRSCLKEGLLSKKQFEKGLYKKMNNNYKVLDMFCGAGGLSKGFIDAGYEVVLGVDFDEAALETFKANHGDAKALKLNLFNDNEMELLIEEAKKNKIDILVGGPPCQGFSLAGNRNEKDDRNKLYERMVELAKKIKPNVVVLENVPGMITLYGGKAKERILEDFKKLGYRMTYKILYAPEYGVPQIRKRVFFVGLLNCDSVFEYPEPLYSNENEFIGCKEAIGDLPTLENLCMKNIKNYEIDSFTDYQKKMREKSNVIYNHIPTKHTEKVINLISLVPEGENYKSLPKELVGDNTFSEYLTRYHSEKPSKTIDTGHRVHFHYKWNRIPTVRENARLQSFPDDFIFYGNKTQQYRQVGNAVPPLLGYHLGLKLKRYMEMFIDEEI
ncbi:DNA cytosine methyltransferase [Cetobacterium sp.]|uniref:DNA cytosine methyltransferase n=1 Tax=Cetobacterium sp. TaxID=2071632 RepID=UPI003F36A36D